MPGVGQVTIRHRLVNCLHDGKERLAIVAHKVRVLMLIMVVMVIMGTMAAMQVSNYMKKGKQMKPTGYGDMSKVSTSTCMVCLQPPKTYNKVRSVIITT